MSEIPIYNTKELNREKILGFCLGGLTTDGAHHKQWFLDQILKELEPKAEEIFNISWDEGIP